jgi:glutathione S-transferase
MKLYDYARSPNARRVRIFLAEKGLAIPLEPVDIARGESRAPDYLARNPMGQVPLLELDDGTYLAESVAICRYFEEAQPDRPLFGTTARSRAEVEMWTRRIELALFQPILAVWKHTSPAWAGRGPQVPEVATAERARAVHCFVVLDDALADREFLAGDRFSIADILGLCTIDFGLAAAEVGPAPELRHVARWHAAIAARPSARA